MWYKSEVTGKIIADSTKYSIDSVCGDGTFDGYISNGLLKEVEPSVVDVLKSTRSRTLAARRFKEIHGVDLENAMEEVSKIQKDIYRFQRKAKKGSKK